MTCLCASWILLEMVMNRFVRHSFQWNSNGIFGHSYWIMHNRNIGHLFVGTHCIAQFGLKRACMFFLKQVIGSNREPKNSVWDLTQWAMSHEPLAMNTRCGDADWSMNYWLMMIFNGCDLLHIKQDQYYFKFISWNNTV